MKLSILTLAFAILAFIPLSQAMDKKASMANIKAVVFFSETCSSCKILEPRLTEAMNVINPDKLQIVKFDFTDKKKIMATKELAEKQNVNDILQKYGARTGFVSLVNKDGQEVDLINVDDNTADIAAKLAKAIASAS